MARGKGKGRKGKANLLGQYGMPSKQQLRQQAMFYAAGAVPSRASVTHPYEVASNDVTGFTAALADILGQQRKAVSSGYDEAFAQQQAIDSAAQNRLSSLGPEYANAIGSANSSGMTSLTAQGAAAKNYANQQPGIAGSRGALEQLGLTQAKLDALRQRSDAKRQAYMQALPQVQQNAMAMAQANASIFQNDRQFGEAQRQFNQQLSQNQSQFDAGQSLQWAQLAEQHAQFNSSQRQQWRQFVLSSQAAGKSSTAAKLGFTPTQWRSAQREAAAGAGQAIDHGVPVDRFISDAVTRGIPKELAVWTALRTYGKLKGPNPRVHPKRAAAYQSFVNWMIDNKWNKYIDKSAIGSRRGRD